ncbi:MAG: hypothetical protein JWM64_1861 [Frankiales bacterium]|nr:hypothetical protein [Frankiales bacterium]
MQHVDVVHDSSLPPERVLAFLAVHENLGPLLGAKVRTARPGPGGPTGVGSVRELRIGPLPAFEETVTAVEEGRSIDYRISKGSPLKGHRGRIEVDQLGSGSRVRWTIDFDAAVPGLAALVRLVLQRQIGAGLGKLDRLA